jgi:hypothetical protein
MTPLQWAATMGSNGVADLLVAAGAELDLWSAAGLGRLDVVERLGPSPAADGDHGIVSDACHIACRNGHVDVAAFLLDRGAEIDRRGYFGATGLPGRRSTATGRWWRSCSRGARAPTPSTTRSTRHRSSGPWKAGTTRSPASSGSPREVVRR